MPTLADTLQSLGLRHTAAHLDDVVALATKRRWSPTQLLEHLAELEQQERTRRSLERRLARSRLGRFTPMSAFDWAWPTRIDRPAVEAAVRLDFLSEARNVVLVAPQGLGKTMLAQNIAHAAVLAGHHVLFTTAAQLLLDLGSQESARGLARRLNHYSQRGLLVIDSCAAPRYVELLPAPSWRRGLATGGRHITRSLGRAPLGDAPRRLRCLQSSSLGFMPGSGRYGSSVRCSTSSSRGFTQGASRHCRSGCASARRRASTRAFGGAGSDTSGS